jgi:predicted nucleotidyltransferase component of viral defense system
VIGRVAIEERVREWGLREDVVEKDYVLGWLLWGIGSDSELGHTWIFKGGTCLKKCYIETYRFSEDLDFTIAPPGPLLPEELAPRFDDILRRITRESGLDFSARPPTFRLRPSGHAVEGRIYYRGPRNSPVPAGVKLDLTTDELVARPTVLRPIAHQYDDALPAPAAVRCYSFEEVFAEKLRALAQRCRPRDLYDVINLFWRRDLRAAPDLIRAILVEKCAWKQMAVPTFALMEASPFRAELEGEWGNMLAHQLPALPTFEQFWAELPTLFGWLDGTVSAVDLPSVPAGSEEDATWSPPPTAWVWGAGIPLEAIRFAGANRLCVELRYQGSSRLIEPYSLRRTRDGNLLLHARKVDTREHRSYRVDRIQGIRVTTRAFTPVYAVEFSQAGPITAPPANTPPSTLRTSAAMRSSSPGRITYVVECPRCGKHFERTRRDTALRPHKDPSGWACAGRRGHLIDTRYG